MTPFETKNILVHVNAQSPSESVLDCAVEIAKSSNGKLTVVDVIPGSPWPVSIMTTGAERAIEMITHGKSEQLEEIAKQLTTRGVTAKAKLLERPSSVAMVREVVREKHDLVISEAKGKHSRRAGFFGTTATRLLRKCPCPLLLLEPGRPWQSRRVVSAVDATSDDAVQRDLNRKIVAAAQPFCPNPQQLDVVCAWTPYGESVLKGHMPDEEFDLFMRQTKSAAERRLNELVKEFGLSLDASNVHLLHGDAADIIKMFTVKHKTDLLVLGTVGRSGIAGVLIGNIAEQILNQITCSVLAIKPDDFKTPIHV